MNVSLTPELEKLVNDKVSSGMYQTASEVIREALRALQQRDQLRERELQAIREKIDRGLEQIERGEYIEYDERTVKDLAEEVKTRGRQRLAKEPSKSGSA